MTNCVLQTNYCFKLKWVSNKRKLPILGHSVRAELDKTEKLFATYDLLFVIKDTLKNISKVFRYVCDHSCGVFIEKIHFFELKFF